MSKQDKQKSKQLVPTEATQGTTNKKLKNVGTKKYIDAETGEVVEMNIVEMESRDFNFEKIWLGHLLQALDTIGNQKIKVIMWLLHNKNNENIILANQRMIGKMAGVGLSTVNDTIKELKKVDFLTNVQGVQGAYQINPNVIFKGSNSKRMSVLFDYTKPDDEEQTKIAENPDQTVITDKNLPKP